MTLNTFSFTVPESTQTLLDASRDDWARDGKVERVWARDASVWTGTDESKWLGWLNVVDAQLGEIDKYRDLRTEIETAGFKNILLMGMGGSSLCPEVLAMTFHKPHFRILDSTVPAQIAAVEEALDLERTLFIVASKSGSTLEPNCFKQYFFDKVSERIGTEKAGRQFIAITDPGSKMEQAAKNDGFLHIFYGDPEIGGRFSALSAFGMTAAAAMGLDTGQFLRSASEMVEACKQADPELNPGAMLGRILGACSVEGRDKFTIFASPEIHDLGAWLEQLIAESTGKLGKAIIPVDREEPQPADRYSNDRVFAFLSLKGDEKMDEHYRWLASNGHPAVRIELDSIDALGQEFFRWEFAIAVAGSIMEIDPFNQPDVESAKIEARKLTDEYEKAGKLPDEAPFFESEDIALFTSEEYAAKLLAAAEEETVSSLIDAHLGTIGAGDYFGLLAYVPMSLTNEEVLDTIRTSVLDRFECATCLGFGPRFLHSTGQAYKGGGPNGVFLQVTANDQADLAVPGQKYTFGVVKDAQARGDFQVLLDRGRRALRVHLKSSVADGLKELSVII
jgi:transaldolase / glucose-6-phosphate isomerase